MSLQAQTQIVIFVVAEAKGFVEALARASKEFATNHEAHAR